MKSTQDPGKKAIFSAFLMLLSIVTAIVSAYMMYELTVLSRSSTASRHLHESYEILSSKNDSNILLAVYEPRVLKGIGKLVISSVARARGQGYIDSRGDSVVLTSKGLDALPKVLKSMIDAKMDQYINMGYEEAMTDVTNLVKPAYIMQMAEQNNMTPLMMFGLLAAYISQHI